MTDPRHGTANGYTNLKCRCERCTVAWRDYHFEWMRAHPDAQERNRVKQRLYWRAKQKMTE
jgi:hypothetical protein